jgi:hypothetical protein
MCKWLKMILGKLRSSARSHRKLAFGDAEIPVEGTSDNSGATKSDISGVLSDCVDLLFIVCGTFCYVACTDLASEAVRNCDDYRVHVEARIVISAH